MSKYAFVDVDGTLTTGSSSWEKVHHYFGVVDEMVDHSHRFFSGEITYEEWALLDVALWKGRPYRDLHKALNPPELIKGAKEGIQWLREHGYKVVLLSGGIDVMVNEVAKIVGADAAYSNAIGHTDGILDGSVGVTVGLKAEVIHQIVEREGADLASSVAIGDNINDVDMFELVGKTLAINPKVDQLVGLANHVVETDNFVEAVKVLLEG